jgi:hypothetical protein
MFHQHGLIASITLSGPCSEAHASRNRDELASRPKNVALASALASNPSGLSLGLGLEGPGLDLEALASNSRPRPYNYTANQTYYQ